MSEENVEIVRQPLAPRAHTHRHLEERLALRFPQALAALVRAALRLPPRSRLRRAFVRRAAQLGCEALLRGDLEATYALDHPDVELDPPKELVGLGLDPPKRGHDERVSFQRKLDAEWELRYDFEEIIDLGDDRLMLVGRFKGTGPSSGVRTDDQFAAILTFSAGQIVRDQTFFNHAEALNAAGLSE